jgi:hypothetical protein
MEQIENLEQAVARLDRTAGEIHSALRRRTQVFIATIAVVAIVAACLIGVVYRTSLDNSRAIEANNAQFCDMIRNSAASTPPATTPRGRSLQVSAGRLYRSLGCRPKLP